MAQNEHINKVVYNGNTLIDLTNDTLTDASQVADGETAHLKSGKKVTGTGSQPSVLVVEGRAYLTLPSSMARVDGTNLIIEEAE